MKTRISSIKLVAIAAFAVTVFLPGSAQAQSTASTVTDESLNNRSGIGLYQFQFLAPIQRLSFRHAGISLMPETRAGINTGVIAPLAAGPNLQVLGSGALGRLTKWTGFTSSNSFIGNSNIFEDKFGMVGIGTDAPTSKLTVAGVIQSTLGFKFPDGTLQTSAGLTSIPVPLSLTGAVPEAVLNVVNTTPGGQAVVATAIGGVNGGIPAIAGVVEGGGGTGVRGITKEGFGVTGNSGDPLDPPGPNTLLVGVSGVTVNHVGIGVFGSVGPFVALSNVNGGVVGVGDLTPGTPADGVTGRAVAGNGVVGSSESGNGVVGMSDTGLAGLFQGNVDVTGTLNVTGAKNFKIDHPLDPENKFLYHAAIESAEALNVYSGNASLNPDGEAVVELPAWFQAINKDFRYTLTPVGAPAAGLHIAQEINGNRFKIAGGLPGMKVSWQVTGVRADRAMLAHPFRVEEDKSEAERGRYLRPELYAQPAEKSVEWGRNPRLMEQMKRIEEQIKAKSQTK